MTNYSPFPTGFQDLTIVDLPALRDTVEGWYVEYKREVPSASSIAKSVTAFANTYGGWLFYGVEEKSKTEAVAGAFPGIARADVDASLQRIRQAVANMANPSPHFDIKPVWGDDTNPDLSVDHAVICIHVPWSPNAPHVHRSGSIYRRVADGSEPKPESDRALLDQLFRRADKIRDDFADWLDRDPELSKGEGEQPWLRLMLATDLWRDRDLWLDIDIEEVRAIMGRPEGIVGALPFNTVYTHNSGFIARQLGGNDPFNHGLVWRLGRDLVSDIIIPLPWVKPRFVEMLPTNLEGYMHVNRFAQMLKDQQHKTPRIVDLNYVFNLLIGIVEIQRRLLERAGWTDGYFAKARLLSVWRTVPFIDVKAVLDGFEMHGVPVCLNGVVTTPAGSSPDSFASIGIPIETDNDQAEILLDALSLFAPIARAYGIPTWIDPDENDPPYFHELQLAGQRAMEAQRCRQQRAEEEKERDRGY